MLCVTDPPRPEESLNLCLCLANGTVVTVNVAKTECSRRVHRRPVMQQEGYYEGVAWSSDESKASMRRFEALLQNQPRVTHRHFLNSMDVHVSSIGRL